jgi:hypothetical protein
MMLYTSIVSNGGMRDELESILYRYFPAGTEKSKKTSVRVVGIPAEVRTEYTSLESYRRTIPFYAASLSIR